MTDLESQELLLVRENTDELLKMYTELLKVCTEIRDEMKLRKDDGK